MPVAFLRRRCLLAAVLLPFFVPSAHAQSSARLPPAVEAALEREHVPREAMSAWVQEVDGPVVRLAANAQTPVNPASLFKLVTTYAALDLLGPAWSWTTPVWFNGNVDGGMLDGSLIIQGRGDPKLVVERLWLLLQRVRQLGVREISGDIVIDQAAFKLPDGAPADFDNEPSRPYNVRAEALLLNLKSVIYTFRPDPQRGVAAISAEPELEGVVHDAGVPLVNAPCADWRGGLKASFADPLHARFAGAYPRGCGELSWPVAYAEPARYNARLIEAMWRQVGGRLGGSVRDGPSPTATPPTFEFTSPPLAEVVRDINKHSNNPMAQQLFLTLGLQRAGAGTPEAARAVLRPWLAEQLGERGGPNALPSVVIDNGSGLSRETRLSAAQLARLLKAAWASPVMPELMASLPINGIDGTQRRSKAPAGRAHLKTGSLRDVAGVAGYVLAASGKRYVVVAIIQHPNANAARAALDAVVSWAINDRP